ncbi:MAG: galactose/methyl galactoside ABC transporter permease MglC [Lachnospiraceae bacterium]|nr:galactose/methyl galactoside ABC transporter permease MglC [Lachnospiraceae bacterium]
METTKKKRDIKRILLDNAIYIILLVIIAVIVILEPSFFNIRNASFILAQASPRLILALGVAGIIILGGTDLAAGRMVGMAAVITASLLQDPNSILRVYPNMPQLPVILPILLAMLICAAFSVFHGFMVAKFKVAPFIASLGIQQIVFGAFSIYFQNLNDAQPLASLDPKFTAFVQTGFSIGSFWCPMIIIYAVLCTIIMYFIWNKTKIGKNMYAVGGNPEAATVCGVNLLKTFLLVYFIAGMLYGFSGSLEAARTGSVTNQLGAEYALDAIAACVVGGVSMRGGIGRISGVVIGVVVFQVINYGLNYLGVNPYMQYIVKGAIILVAVAIDTQKYLKKK